MNTIVTLLKKDFDIDGPSAGFCLWLKIPFDDEEFTVNAYQYHNLRVLPGQYLAREVDGINPGFGFLRLALVHPLDICISAIGRLLESVSLLSAK